MKDLLRYIYLQLLDYYSKFCSYFLTSRMKLPLNRFEYSSRLESFAVIHVHEKEQVHACTVMSTIDRKVVTSNNTLTKVAIYFVTYLVLGQGVTIISIYHNNI